MKQLSLAETGFRPKAGQQTRKSVFLAEMETVVPWSRLEALMLEKIDDVEKEGNLSVLTPTKKPAGGVLTQEQKAFNRMLSAVRAMVGHPFRVVKRQFGLVKVRYHGLAKNTKQILTLFALANLWLASKRLLPLLGAVRL